MRPDTGQPEPVSGTQESGTPAFRCSALSAVALFKLLRALFKSFRAAFINAWSAETVELTKEKAIAAARVATRHTAVRRRVRCSRNNFWTSGSVFRIICDFLRFFESRDAHNYRCFQ